MANQKHVSILIQGTTVWNKWRKKNTRIIPTFSKADLTNASFSGVDLSGVDLSKADLTNANFWGADLTEADFSGAKLTNANFRGADLTNADLTNASFRGADLTNAKLGNAKLTNANFRGADLTNANFWGADLTEADFSGAKLTNASFWRATLTEADFSGAKLTNASFRGAKLTNASFRGANLTEANLTEADLTGADLTGATLNSANFQKSIVDGYTLISGCKIDKKTDFRDTGLDNARIDSGIKELLKLNIRYLNWKNWYKNHKIAQWPTKLFWNFSNYGSSTLNLIIWFFLSASFFALIYFYRPDMIEGLIKKDCNIIGGCENIPNKYSPLLFFRAFYFSIVTMTTLGFGDMHANINNGWGYFWLIIQVLLGYFLLGALITRLSVLFTAEGPAGKYPKKENQK